MFSPNAHRRLQAGFTLIELIVVITILGVLAAVALPRFTNLQADARFAKAQALAGSVRAAAAQVKAAALVRGVACNTATVLADQVTLEGNAQIDTVACYPTSAEIALAANITAAADGVTIATSGATPPVTSITVNGGGANCVVTYAQPAAGNGMPTVTTPTDASSC
jgi:MSHA pilin protein MshA